MSCRANWLLSNWLDDEQDLNNKRLAVHCKSVRNGYSGHNRSSRLVSLAGSSAIRDGCCECYGEHRLFYRASAATPLHYRSGTPRQSSSTASRPTPLHIPDRDNKEKQMNMGRLPVAAPRATLRQLFRGLALIATALVGTCFLFAQTDRGSIEGTVRDPNGAIVPGAKVQVVNIESNSNLDFQSNELGHSLAAALPVGSYRLIVQREGFARWFGNRSWSRRRATW